MVESVAKAWADSAEPGGSSLGELVLHVEGCPACRRRWPGLLSLARRDAGIRLLPSAEDLSRTERLSAALASRLKSLPGPHPRILPSRRRRVARLALLSAAALFAFLLCLPLVKDKDMVTVRFSLEAPQAQSVFLAGDFSSWAEGALRLDRVEGSGTWELSLKLKRGRAYLYNFIIDGDTWLTDPAQPSVLDDGFGGSSSSLRI